MTYMIEKMDHVEVKYIQLNISFKYIKNDHILYTKPLFELRDNYKQQIEKVLKSNDKLDSFCLFCDELEQIYNSIGIKYSNQWKWIKGDVINLMIRWKELIDSGDVKIEWFIKEKIKMECVRRRV